MTGVKWDQGWNGMMDRYRTLRHKQQQEAPKEKPMYDATYTLEVHPPCLGLVVVLNEIRMVELLETERKYKLLLDMSMIEGFIDTFGSQQSRT